MSKRIICLTIINQLIVFLFFLPTVLLAKKINLIDNFNTWNLSDYEQKYGIISVNKQSPLLKAMVKKGSIPKLKDRLPIKNDILVVSPRSSIGIYGGEITFNATNPTSFGNT